MKCPRCGELWFDAEEEYSLDVCDRCESDPEPAADIVPKSTKGRRRARKRTPRRTGGT